ncbi:hypothetical protein RVR_9712 [Actinacidiphila reveromycinica]|uniref:Secreted protein n=1 Tax=Actinacidiphila reveromycinica TaxID=659352 RepID=A0A7U3V042_9ACTN|nr:hypothetical protein [Streptomyces sp. SN-593]BBB02024.1 hypothetical protein RVR_9712 [Streptomyces sp. SN-593]
MKTLRPLLGAAATAAALGGLLLVPGTASATPADTAVPSVQAYEWNTAVSGSTPPADCLANAISMTGSEACFERYGDVLWVKDTKADGHSATNSWDNYLDGSLYRRGSCVNKLGSGQWGYCNKDMYEGSVVDYAACVYDAATGGWYGCTGSLSIVNDE